MTARIAGGKMIAAVAALIVITVAAATLTRHDTTASWIDPATVTVAASAGEWSTGDPSDVVIVPGNDATVVEQTQWEISASDRAHFCVSSTVSGVDGVLREWEVHADLTKPPFNGASGSSWWSTGSSQVSLARSTTDPNVLRITGVGDLTSPWNSAYNNRLITSGQHLSIRVCVQNTPQAAMGDASWYTASQRSTTWTDTQACIELTVRGKVTDLEANPFYFGWAAQIDLTAAKQRIIGAGKTLNYLAWSPDPSHGYQFNTSPQATQPVPDRYALTSGNQTTVRGTQAVVLTACVMGH